MDDISRTKRKEWLWLLKPKAVKAVRVEESHNCKARTLDGALRDRKSLRLVEGTDLKVGG